MSLAMLVPLLLVTQDAELDKLGQGTIVVADVDLKAGLVLAEEWHARPVEDESGMAVSKCTNKFLQGKGLTWIVFDLRARQVVNRYTLAGFPTEDEGPCPTQASYDKKRADAVEKIKARGLDANRAEKPIATKVEIVSKRRDSEVDTYVDTHGLERNGVRLYEAKDEVQLMGAGKASFAAFLVEEDGFAMVLEQGVFTNMRGGWTNWRAIGPLALPTNRVDAAKLKIAAGDGKCAVSIAANAPLERTVAVSVRSAIDDGGKRTVAITKATKARDASVVYAKAECSEIAKALAAAVPGGATVDVLNWDSKAPIVIALGSSAAPK